MSARKLVRWRRALTASALVLAAAALAAVGDGAAGAQAANGRSAATVVHPARANAARRGGTLNVAISPGFLNSNLDPGLGTEAIEMVDYEIFDQLVKFVPGSSQPRPDIATSWTVSKNGLQYDFHLRKGVRFSNGAPLTASDVAFTLRRMESKANVSGQWITPGEFKSITIVNPHEIKFVLHKPVAAMLANLADDGVSILPKSIVTHESESAFALHPVGSGPFMVKSYSPGTSLSLVRNPYYWNKPLPYLNGINYSIVSDPSTRILDVRSGQDQVADSVPYSQIESLQKTTGVQMLVRPWYAIDEVYWNTATGPFSDVKVRQALAYATPYKNILHDVYHGFAQQANSVIPKNQYWDAKVPYYNDDLTRAKQLMNASSWAHGFSATILVPSGDADMTLMAEILQSSWKAVGVTLKIVDTPAGSILTHQESGNYEVALLPTGSFFNDVPAPDDGAGLTYDYSSGTHGLFSYFKSPLETRLYLQAVNTTNTALRAADFRQLQAYSVKQVQFLPLAFVPVTYLTSAHLQNFETVGGGWDLLYEASLGRS